MFPEVLRRGKLTQLQCPSSAEDIGQWYFESILPKTYDVVELLKEDHCSGYCGLGSIIRIAI